MRDLTKSMTTFGWAMSVFGVQQMVNLLSVGSPGQSDKCAESFNHVSQAAAETLGASLGAAYAAGDRLQSGMADLLFGGLLSAGMDPTRMMQMGTNAMQQATGCCGGSAANSRMPNASGQRTGRG